ncbi:MAG: nucleotidyltransferase domain-containing protein [Methanobacteriaceae archaeon]|jgi:predicted nucleotidyltransferase|nr:nucleotidyltransferase domain-containing protein [Methanobacteriaceae archaeon]MDO9626087.1 nucleotidyltransferase domain-containing protein [Methanobacteriaceae archaeon]
MKSFKVYPEAVDEFVNNIIQHYKRRIDIIFLFGSLARGKAREESDIDILVVVDLDLDENVDVSFFLLLKYGKIISPKDMKKSRFDKMAKEGFSFINNVLTEGVVLYERVGKASAENKSANILLDNQTKRINLIF